MQDSRKGNTVLLTVIAIATLLVALVGATFAYFTATVKGNETASSVIVNTATLGTVTYKNGNELRIDSGLPGVEKEVQFTVSSDSSATAAVDYYLNWADVTNTFASNDELVYSVIGEITTPATGSYPAGTLVSADNVTVPHANGVIGSVGRLQPGETHTYTLVVRFRETGSDQNSNQGKAFAGKISVTTGESAYYNNDNPTGTPDAPDADEGIVRD